MWKLTKEVVYVKNSKSLPQRKDIVVNDKDKQGMEEGLDINCPNDFGKAKRNWFGLLKISVPRFQQEGCFAWY